MAMMVDWEYFFPDVYFKHDRFETWSKEDLSQVVGKDGNWSPQKDFEFHLQKLKVDSKYFDEKNKNLFPERFVKNTGKYYLGSIITFEQARIELLNRVQFSFVEQREKETYNEDLDDYEYEDYPIFKIELLELNKDIEVEKGTISSGADECKFYIRSKKNVITSHRFNAINILYDWLLSLSPRGSYDNNWQIFAYGISEYDETLSYIDTFIVDDKDGQTSIDGFDNGSESKIISQTLIVDTLSKNSFKATDARDILLDWNPFIK